MATTHDIAPGRLVDLGREVVGLAQDDRRARIVEQRRGRPPERIAGVTIGAPVLEGGEEPHDGEVHPDGDELLFLVSGAASVRLELPDGDRTVTMGPGDALVVPQGVWHKLTVHEPGRLLHVTPGPDGAYRPRA